MAVKQYSADEVFSIMDGLEGGNEEMEVSESDTVSSDTSSDFSVPGLDESTQERATDTGTQATEEPGWKTGVRENVLRPIVEAGLNPREALKGAFKGVGSTLMGASRLGESVFENTVGQIPRIWGGKELGRNEADYEMEAKIFKALEAENKAQQFGKFAEGVAETIIPGLAGTKTVNAYSTAKNVGKLGKASLEIGTQAGIGGITEAVKQGEFNAESAKAALISGAATGIFEGVGGIYRAIKGTPVKDELAAVILGPTGNAAKQFDEAADGIVAVAESLPNGQRAIAKELSKTESREGFQKLAERATKLQDSVWGELEAKLGGITAKERTTEVGEAISIAKETLGNQPGNAARKALFELEELGAKNVSEGLTPLEMTRVKILFSNAENMYNALGGESKGMAAEALRDVRNALKSRIEKEAAKNGVNDVADLNSAWGSLAAAKNMLENRSLDFVKFTGRQLKESLLQRATGAIMNLPVVKQLGTQPLQTLTQIIGKGLRGDKMSVLDVEKRIPEILNDLRKAGLKPNDSLKVSDAIRAVIRSEAVKQEQEYQDRKMGISPNA